MTNPSLFDTCLLMFVGFQDPEPWEADGDRPKEPLGTSEQIHSSLPKDWKEHGLVLSSLFRILQSLGLRGMATFGSTSLGRLAMSELNVRVMRLRSMTVNFRFMRFAQFFRLLFWFNVIMSSDYSDYISHNVKKFMSHEYIFRARQVSSSRLLGAHSGPFTGPAGCLLEQQQLWRCFIADPAWSRLYRLYRLYDVIRFMQSSH